MSEKTQPYMLTLREAVHLYQKEEDPVPFSYNWYILSAEAKGKVSFSGFPVPVKKLNGTWYIARAEFFEAIEQHRRAVEYRKQVTRDYEEGIIHGNDGDTIEGQWLTYTVRGDFHFVRTEHDYLLGHFDGAWYCNKCNTLAEVEHNKEECNLCKHSKGCGTDCTLSRVYCPNCGANLDL